MQRKCEKCGKLFEVPMITNSKTGYSRPSKRKFCDDCSDGKPTRKLICKNCGKEFEVGKDKSGHFKIRQYCSEKCMNDMYRKSHPKKKKYNTCRICGKKFEAKITPSGCYSQVTICDECDKEKRKKTCLNCGKVFYPKKLETSDNYSNSKFCSDECREDYYRKNKEKRFPRFRKCEVCGKIFEEEWLENKNRYSESVYCSDVCYRIGYKQKREKTMLEKYGVKHHLQLQEFKNKQKDTCLEKYGVPYPCYTEQCLNSNPTNNSKINQKFECLLKNNNIQYKREFVIGDFIYDFYLENYNVVLEINPNHTHSTLPDHWSKYFDHKSKSKNYHLNKLNVAKDNGYRCIHVWQWDDWSKIVSMFLPNKQKLYARNLKLKIIDNIKEVNEFLNTFHLQNSCKGNLINLGLYDKNDQLIQVMTFGKPRYNKNYQYELLRLCTNYSFYVIGGAEKLFKYFTNNYQPQSIISYCDISKFNGNVYERLGFKLKDQTKPSKHWGNNKESKVHITDNLLRQRGFDQLVGSKLNPPQLYGKGTDNEQLMLEHGWLPVYDCGQKVFVWEA